ncbi:MAG: hypothetical protein EZS28_032093 [Streblomastix strix]|uniref:Uncharacterized protein n=1 Tax=Streblomastix strix TaxID=222440 RepID=A0A5J4UQL8_9EUKA|nr:MAG: hypothetical protein EZS28_032093 [Streblomastix strix]
MIPPEKPDLIYLLHNADPKYQAYSVRIVNMEGKGPGEKIPTNSISQIKDAIFDKLEIHNVCFNIENEEAIIDMIRMQKILNFPTQILRTQSSNFPFSGFTATGVPFQKFNLVIDQRHVIPQEYTSLNPMSINESNGSYFGKMGTSYINIENVFYSTTLYRGSKSIKIYYPHKFMLAWKMATYDSFMRGYNSSKMGARINIQVTLQGNLTPGIVDSELIKFAPDENQNNFIQFVATRAFPTPTNAQITSQMRYLCDAIIRFTFDDAPDPQVLNFEIIGEIGGTMVRSG